MTDDIRWFEENDNNQRAYRISIDRLLHEGQSRFQKVLVFENAVFGRVLILDDCFMVTELDEFFYHETIAHVSLFSHPAPRRVLIIGGGDGGTLREVLKHPVVEEAVLCEIDEQVVEVSRNYLPFTACEMDNPRAKVVCEDGFAFVKAHPGAFDVIIVDGTDPIGPGAILFTPDFYRLTAPALRPGGIFVQQTGAPLFYPQHYAQVYRDLRSVFASAVTFLGPAPTYPSGYWSYCLARQETSPLPQPSQADVAALGELKYYTAAIHAAAFIQPPFVQRLVKG